MRFPAPLIPGTLVRRYQRFLCDVRLADGRIVVAHCPNSGSLLGCKDPGSPVLLSDHNRPDRRLRYTWEMVRVGRIWVGINTARPNRLVEAAIERDVITELRGYRVIRREVMVGSGTRLDLLLGGPRGRRCYVEVKNVTSRPDDGLAAFPDAVTLRGQRHLRVLMRLRRRGHRAVVLFVVQRGDCRAFRPWEEVDPDYARLLRRAVKAGVEALPYQARVRAAGIELTSRLSSLL
ncbi:MAG TPA: DNA/RNA nuclease SfsA [Methylomirabilota bacterium]|nr:DNA/RNA nuclease SfsA [Methylomirabilota bacterium]